MTSDVLAVYPRIPSMPRICPDMPGTFFPVIAPQLCSTALWCPAGLVSWWVRKLAYTELTNVQGMMATAWLMDTTTSFCLLAGFCIS
jgi:hypothetical protein